MSLIAMQDIEDLYNELLEEHEKALNTIESLQNRIDELIGSLEVPKELREKTTIKGNNILLNTRFADISSIQAMNGGIYVKLNDMAVSFLWSSLSKYKEELPLMYFKQISESCMINTSNVKIKTTSGVQMKNGDKFKISESFKNEF